MGDFSARSGFDLIDPLSGEPFPMNRIPADRIDPLGSAFARLYPDPNAPGPVTAAPRDNYVKNVSNRGQSDFLTIKVDHNFGQKDRISSRFSNVNAPAWPAPVYPNEFADFRGSRQTRSNLVSTSTWNHNFTTTMVNEFRYTYGNRTFTTRGLGTGSGKNGELGVPQCRPGILLHREPSGLHAPGRGQSGTPPIAYSHAPGRQQHVLVQGRPQHQVGRGVPLLAQPR